MSPAPSISLPPHAVALGLDPGTHTVGLCVLPFHDELPVRLVAIPGGPDRDEDTRLVQIVLGVAQIVMAVQRGGHHIIAIGVERPSDRFEGDRHDVSFMLGRAFDRLVTFGRRILHVPTYELLPAECSQAIGCARGASKPTRNRMSARIIGIEDWDDQAGRGTFQGAQVGRDELDSHAAAFAGRGAHMAALVAQAARAASPSRKAVARSA